MGNCKVDGCETKVDRLGYCIRHYGQVYKNGKVSDRTIFDPNEFTIVGDAVRITLFDKDCNVCGEAIIDKTDLQQVEKHKWCLIQKRDAKYCGSKINGKQVYLHRLLMGFKNIDHIDRDPLNNRRSNLREATTKQNIWNSKYKSHNKCGFKGVYKSKNRWAARICKDGVRKFLGSFETPEEAAVVYNDVASKLYGEFAYLNEVGQ